MKTPILIIGDAPSATSGLGRITRDLALRINTHMADVFEVATYGYGGLGDRSLGFQQYNIEGMTNWFMPTLRQVWENFAGTRKGVVLTIFDASRLLWFARPDNPSWCPDPAMREWLLNAPFEKWGYFPMDATGPNGKLTMINAHCLAGFHKIIAYSEWAKTMIDASLPSNILDTRDVIALPHGLDTDVFQPRMTPNPRHLFQEVLGFNGPPIAPDEKLVGIVATNQARKDYGLAMSAMTKVMEDVKVRLFINTDVLERYWSIPALIMDHGILPQCIVNCNVIPDHLMSVLYSACDLTLGIGAGEGFGYPIFESLACGTPVLTGTYGGHAEHLPEEMLVSPEMYRLEGVYNCVRPVYDPTNWAYWTIKRLRERKTGASLLPEDLDWKNLWPLWETYFRGQQARLEQGESRGMLKAVETHASAGD